MKPHSPKLNSVEKTEATSTKTVRFTLLELGLWITVFAVAWSAPSWMGENAVLVSFYGIIAVMSMRFKRLMPFWLSLLLAFMLGLLATWVTVYMVNR